MSGVKQLLPKQHIQVLEQVESWQTATRIASQPLLSEQLIEEVYVENMISSVYEHGPYMVLSDYFSLMHATPGIGVNEESMSLLVTKKAVDFEGRAVKIFLVLAALDSRSHLESLQKIMEVFMDEEKYQIILGGNQQAIEKLFC